MPKISSLSGKTTVHEDDVLPLVDTEAVPDTTKKIRVGDLINDYTSIYNIKEFGAKVDGSTDDTTAVQAAIDAAEANVQSVWRGGGVVFFPEGETVITSTLTVNNSNVVLMGCAPDVSIIKFEPTANDVCVHFAQVLTSDIPRRGHGIRDIGFRSVDQSWEKTAIRIDDVTRFLLENVYIGKGGAIATAGFWWTNYGGSKNCIGIDLRGREHITFKNLHINADRPIVGNLNPSATPGFIADQWTIRDALLNTSESDGKCIEITAEGGLRGVHMENVFFLGCKWGFYHTATSNTDYCANWHFENCLIETLAADGWAVYISRTGTSTDIIDLLFTNWSGPSAGLGVNGFYLYGVENIAMVNVENNADDCAIDVDNQCNYFTGHRCRLGTGQTGTASDWVTSTSYTTSDVVSNNTYEHYRCISNHTSSASDEPGVGGSWATYWKLISNVEMIWAYASGMSNHVTYPVQAANFAFTNNAGNRIGFIPVLKTGSTANFGDKDHLLNSVCKEIGTTLYNTSDNHLYTCTSVGSTGNWKSSEYSMESGQVTLSSGTANVTFARTRTNSTFYISLAGDTNETYYWSSKSTTGFTITSSNASSTANVDWIVRSEYSWIITPS